MNIASQNERLNDLLVGMFRSLLQYANECWPWSGVADDTEEQQLIRRLADRQQQGAGRLVEILQARGWMIDFSIYPAEFGDLHYVALEHLMKALLRSEQSLIAAIQRELTLSAGDPDVAPALEELLAAERETERQLQDLATRTPASIVK